MVAARGDGTEPVPLAEVAGKLKTVPLDHPWIESARTRRHLPGRLSTQRSFIMIKLGVIGTGGMANHHATQFGAIDDVQIAACCDVSTERRADFAEKWKVPASAVYADYRDMLAKETFDGVTNVTPDAMHADISIAVLEKSIPFLCEKPMATNLADARRMFDAARKAGVLNMINFSYRNSSGLQAAAEFVRGAASANSGTSSPATCKAGW